MKIKREAARRILLLFGIILLTASVIAFVVSLVKDFRIKVDCEDVAAYIEDILPNVVTGFKEERSNNTLPVITYDGQDYSLLLSVPRFSVKLPVRSAWDRNAVKKVPCVFTGNPYEGTLIIGGADSDGLFGFVPGIDIGDTISVTDMKGNEFTYTVSAVKHADNSRASTLIDEKSDLTLFAKDKKTGDWLLVRCNM